MQCPLGFSEEHMELRLLAVGDVVAPAGCEYLCRHLHSIKKMIPYK